MARRFAFVHLIGPEFVPRNLLQFEPHKKESDKLRPGVLQRSLDFMQMLET